MKILIINAHQRWEKFAEGQLNKTFVELAVKQLKAFDYEVLLMKNMTLTKK